MRVPSSRWARHLALTLAAALALTACGAATTPSPAAPSAPPVASAGADTPAPSDAQPTSEPQASGGIGGPLASLFPEASATPEPTPEVVPTPEPTASPEPTAPPEPTPEASPTPSPAVTPAPTQPPVAAIDLGTFVMDSWTLDTNWGRAAATGTGRLILSISNPELTPLFPACTIPITAGNPNRTRAFPWAGSRTIASGATDQFEIEIGRIPVSIDAAGSGVFTPGDVTCRGVTTKPAYAVADARTILRASIVKSTGSQPSGSRSTITFVFNVTNHTTATVTPACRVQVAGTKKTKPPLSAGEKLKVYVFRGNKSVAAGKTVKLTYKGAKAPTKVTSTKFYWLWQVRCWVP